MRRFYILAAVFLVGISAGIAVTWEQDEPGYILVPIDYDPFLDEREA